VRERTGREQALTYKVMVLTGSARGRPLDLTMPARHGENVYTDPMLLDVAGQSKCCLSWGRKEQLLRR